MTCWPGRRLLVCLLACLLATLGLWRWSQGTVSVSTVATPKVEEKKADDKKVEAKPAGGAKYTLVAMPAPDKKVERLWKSKCGSCHGADGKAQTEKGKKMKMEDYTTAEWQKAKTDDVPALEAPAD